MRIFNLYIDSKRVVCASDKWTLLLYIGQRGIVSNRFEIKKSKEDDSIQHMSYFLNYFMGYALTNDEIEYVDYQVESHISYFKKCIANCKSILKKNKKTLTKKEVKVLKNDIEGLKDIIENDEIFSDVIMPIIETPNNTYVKDYIEMISHMRDM